MTATAHLMSVLSHEVFLRCK